MMKRKRIKCNKHFLIFLILKSGCRHTCEGQYLTKLIKARKQLGRCLPSHDVIRYNII